MASIDLLMLMQGGDGLARAHLAIQMKDFPTAIKLLTSHIDAHPQCYVAYDLRSYCSLQHRDIHQALNDALQCTRLRPTWARGWARLGAAELCNDHVNAAISAYAKGLRLKEGDKELQSGLKLAQETSRWRGRERREAMREGNKK